MDRQTDVQARTVIQPIKMAAQLNAACLSQVLGNVLSRGAPIIGQ